jgi:MFS family permease
MFDDASNEILSFIKRQHIAFKVNIARNLITNFSLGLITQYQSIFITGLGAGALELGYANSIGGIVSTLVTLPVGWLADKYGIKKMLLMGMSIMVLSLATFGVSTTWQFAILGVSFYTISLSVTMVVCPMVCGKTLLNKERVTGMQLCDTVSGLPRLAAPIVAAFLITKYGGMTADGIRPLYWLAAIGYLFAMLFVFRFFQNPSFIVTSQDTFLSGFSRVFQEGHKVKRWILYQSLSVLPMYLGFYIPLYASQVKGANTYVVGLLDSAYWFTVVVLAIPIGLLADKHGRKKMITVMTPLYCFGVLLLVYAQSTIILVLAGVFSGFYFLTLVTESAIGLELVPKELLGSWNALTSLGMGIIGTVAPILGGLIWERVGPDYLLFFLAIVFLSRLLILITLPDTVSWEKKY